MRVSDCNAKSQLKRCIITRLEMSRRVTSVHLRLTVPHPTGGIAHHHVGPVGSIPVRVRSILAHRPFYRRPSSDTPHRSRHSSSVQSSGGDGYMGQIADARARLAQVLAVTHPPLTSSPARHIKRPHLFPALPYAPGSNASVWASSAPPAGSTLVVPSAMEGAAPTTVTIAIMTCRRP